MKWKIFAFVVLNLTSWMSHAQITRKVPMKVDSTKVIEFKGTISTETSAVDALAVYAPSNSLGLSPQFPSTCEFAEDRFFPDGPEQHLLIKAKGNGPNYSLKIPLTGLRNTCKYSLVTILFTINKKPIYEMIQIHTNGSDMTPTVFPSVSKIDCDFGTEMTGICSLNSQMLDFSYRIDPVPQIITVDITQTETTSY